MKQKKKRQNLQEARTSFGWDFSKYGKDKYDVYKIDGKMFDLGMEMGLEPSINVVPDKYKDNTSFVAGFDRAKRILKAKIDSYNMGMQAYFKGVSLDNIPVNYRNSEYYMNGYNYAKNLETENDELMQHKRR